MSCNYPRWQWGGRKFSMWELSRVGIFQVGLILMGGICWVGIIQVGVILRGNFWVRIVQLGVTLGGNFLWVEFSGWELSNGNHPDGNFLCALCRSFHVTLFSIMVVILFLWCVLKGFKGWKIQELHPFSKFITELMILAVAKNIFQLNLVFIADSRTGLCSRFLLKHKVKLTSSYLSCSVKKRCFLNFPNFIGKHLCWNPWGLQVCIFDKRDSNTGVFRWNLRKF